MQIFTFSPEKSTKLRIPFIILYLIILVLPVSAQLHEDVHPGLDGSELFNAVVDDFKPSVVLGYSDAREAMYTEIYNVNDSVSCVYSGHRLYLDPNSSSPIADLVQNNDPDGINCEHTVPKSMGADTGNPKSDIHHLFPTRVQVNSDRGNNPFGDIPDGMTDFWYYLDDRITSIPQNNIDKYSEQINGRFEVREDFKGNAARAVFYFFTMYEEEGNEDFFELQRQKLCEWHFMDPVDELEWDRTEMIAGYQENKRNPFILDCSLAKRIYCQDVEFDCFVGTRNEGDFSGIVKSEIRYNPIWSLPSIYIEIESKVQLKITQTDILGKSQRILLSGDMQPGSFSLFPVESARGVYLINIEINTDEGAEIRSLKVLL